MHKSHACTKLTDSLSELACKIQNMCQAGWGLLLEKVT